MYAHAHLRADADTVLRDTRRQAGRQAAIRRQAGRKADRQIDTHRHARAHMRAGIFMEAYAYASTREYAYS